MNKLPYEDEQELDQDTLDLISGNTLEETDEDFDQQDRDDRNPAAMKYFTNDQSALQPTPKVDPSGQLVGRDPFERLNQLVPQQEQAELQELSLDTPSENPQLSNYENILKQLQDKRKDNNMVVNMARAGNQIAQAIASGSGAKIGDGSENLNAIERSNNQSVSDYHEQIKNQMDDPSSAISKYYRLQTLKTMKEQNPKMDLSQFDSMSANQLKDIVTQKGKSGRGDLFFTTRFNDKTGKSEIVGVNRQTGDVQTSLGERSFGDKIVKDTETGKNTVYSQNTGVKQINDTPDILKTNPADEIEVKKQEEALNTPTSLNQVNPKLYSKFSAQQKAFMSDIKDNREVATSATTLSKKLKPGADNQIDSGLLGGIQTQAAKMAGQKGVLTDQDLVKFAGAGGVNAAMARMVDGSFFGQMSDADIKFFKRFAEKMQESNAEDIKNRSQIFVKNIHNEAKDYLPNLKEENVSKWLNVQDAAPASQQQMVKVISPDGKAGSIPKENLEKALQKGYKEVK